MYCKNCGKQLPDGAQFCDGCGAQQVDGGYSAQQVKSGYVTYTNGREPKPSVGFIDAIKMFFTKYADFNPFQKKRVLVGCAVLRPCRYGCQCDFEELRMALDACHSGSLDCSRCPPSARHRQARHILSVCFDSSGRFDHPARLVLPGQHRRQPVGPQSQVLIR